MLAAERKAAVVAAAAAAELSVAAKPFVPGGAAGGGGGVVAARDGIEEARRAAEAPRTACTRRAAPLSPWKTRLCLDTSARLDSSCSGAVKPYQVS